MVKKSLITFVSIVVLTTFVFAQNATNLDVNVDLGDGTTGDNEIDVDINLGNELDALTGQNSSATDSRWGYNSSISIEIQNVTPNSITLVSPIINDSNGEVIKRYKVTYSLNHINESTPTDLKEKSFDFDDITGDKVYLTIGNLDTTKPYYFVIQPINKNNIAGENSSEVAYDPTQYATTLPAEQHAAATENQNTLNGVSYEVNGSTVTLKWTPLDGASKVKILIKKLEAGINTEFEQKGEPNMADAKYSFEVTSTGEYLVSLLPINDNGDAIGPEVTQTIKIDKIETKVNIKKTPKVGPETNIIIGFMLIAILFYIVYRFRKA